MIGSDSGRETPQQLLLRQRKTGYVLKPILTLCGTERIR